MNSIVMPTASITIVVAMLLGSSCASEPASGTRRGEGDDVRSLRVRVVDRSGAAADGMTVLLRALPSRVILAGAQTSENGVATFEQARALLRPSAVHTKQADQETYETAAVGPGIDVAAPVGDPSGETVTLVLPQTGIVRLRVLQPNGAPRERAIVTIGPGLPESGPAELAQRATTDAKGSVTFPRVGLGGCLHAAVAGARYAFVQPHLIPGGERAEDARVNLEDAHEART